MSRGLEKDVPGIDLEVEEPQFPALLIANNGDLCDVRQIAGEIIAASGAGGRGPLGESIDRLAGISL